MTFRRPFLLIAPVVERTSICRRFSVRQKSPAAAAAVIPTRTHQYRPSQYPRQFTNTPISREKAAHDTSSTRPISKPSSPPQQPQQPRESKTYTYEDIAAMTESPDPNRIIIDVRESAELSQTGHIPGAQHIPLQSSPDFAFLPAPEFESRFGFPKPMKDQEVIFYCKAGVRSRAAAKLAIQAGDFGGRVGEFPGSWIEWESKGGRADRPG